MIYLFHYRLTLKAVKMEFTTTHLYLNGPTNITENINTMMRMLLAIPVNKGQLLTFRVIYLIQVNII